MKIIIDIPTEFECDYVGDKFKDFFSRVLCDIEKGTLCGHYEKEIAEMFLKAFDKSVPMDNIVEKLKHEKSKSIYDSDSAIDVKGAYTKAINIVKQEINNGLE